MANPEHVKKFYEGVKAWNQWRTEHPEIIPDLSEIELCGKDIGVIQRGNKHFFERKKNFTGINLRKVILKKTILGLTILRGADLREAELQEAQLFGADFRKADLSHSEIWKGIVTAADLREANLSHAFLGEAELVNANLERAKLRRANFEDANLWGANFCKAYLREVDFGSANLLQANFCEADLREALIDRANLDTANFYKANLRGADLEGANLQKTNFEKANLEKANLRRTHLIDTNFVEANLSGCQIYGISAWNVRTDEKTIQMNLVITQKDEPIITVDNLKIAQFVYLLLNNPEVRESIDTIAKKMVLILGRFTPERKAVLDAIKDALRQRNYVPMLFDFQKPESRDFTETVSTLAHLACFVIADFTDAKIVLEEVPHIMNSVTVPVKPLLLKETGEEPVTLLHLRKTYRACLETYYYTDIQELINNLEKNIILPAEMKLKELKESY